MKIIFKDSFLFKLNHQVNYIAKDSPKRARKFKADLIKRLKSIPQNPYLFRPSIYFDDKNNRDNTRHQHVKYFRKIRNPLQTH